MADLTTITNSPVPASARLPALEAPELSVAYLAKMKEIIEVMLGRRGSDWDRAVTFRDLQNGGLGGFLPGGSVAQGSPAIFDPGTGTISVGGGAPFNIDAALRNSAAYKALMTRIGSAEELANLPDILSSQISTALADLARERKADIRTVENKIQTNEISMASRLTEITASLEGAAAGVREFDAAYADTMRAVAVRVEQVAAALDTAGGGVIAQELLEATADAVEGLKAQWTLKLQTNPTNGQPPVIAGIALALEDPIAGPGTSSLIFLAEEFGFFTNNGTLLPFSIVGDQITFNGNVLINGTLMFGEDGKLLLAAAAPGTLNTEANYVAELDWHFTTGSDGWGAGSAFQATPGEYFDFTSTTNDPVLYSPALNFFGGKLDKIRMRVKRINAGAWQGQIYYSTGGHSFDEQHAKAIPDTTKIGEWVILEWDMAKLTAGGNDWVSNQITGLRIDLAQQSGVGFHIDWISIGRYGPAASLQAVANKLDKNANDVLNARLLLGGNGKVQLSDDDDNTTVIAPSGIAALKDGQVNLSLSNTGAVIAREFDAIGQDGEVMFSTGKTMGEQTRLNPNLIPRLTSWPAEWRGGGATPSTNTGDNRFINGEYLYLPNGSGYIGASTAPIGIPQGAWVTVTFDAYCEGAARNLDADFSDFIGGGVDTSGISITLTNTHKHYRFTEQISHANAPLARLRIFCSAPGSNVVVSNVKVEYGKNATAWCDNVITKDNVSTFIQAAAIGLALIDRASIANLSALVAFLGNVELGIGGALFAGPATFDSGQGLRIGTDGAGDPYLVLRSTSGKLFRARPSTNTFEADGWKILNPEYSTFTVDFGGDITATGSGTVINMGTRTASVSGVTVASVMWEYIGGGDGSIKIVSATSLTTAFESRVPGLPGFNQGVIRCTVVATDGRTGSATRNLSCDHF